MKLCSRAAKIRTDFQKATEGFRRQELSAIAEGNTSQAEAFHAQGLGSRRAMATRLNQHLEHCRECR